MKQPQPFSLLDVGLPLPLRQRLPASSESFADLSVVDVRLHLDDLLPLVVRVHHEGVHRPSHMFARWIVARLKKRGDENLFAGSLLAELEGD